MYDKGNNYSDLMCKNRSIVAKLIMRHGACSRCQLSSMTGLTQASITNIVLDLIQMGIVEEVPENNECNAAIKGRRPIMLSIRENSFYVIGAKLSRRFFEVGIMNLAGKIQKIVRYTIRDEETPAQVLGKLCRSIETLYAESEKIIAVGISVPGPYLRHLGRIATITEKQGWKNVNLNEALKLNLKVPVYIEHDANAGALAEWWYGNHNCKYLVHMLVGEGVGAGIVYEGQLLLGADGIAGEIGHMTISFAGRNCQCTPLSQGCLEQYCSSISFIRDVSEALPLHPESSLSGLTKLIPESVFKAAETDEWAREMVRKEGFYLGIGIANVINIYNPDVIVISDIMSGGGELLLDSIRETVKGRVIPELYESTRICYSQLPYNTSLFGAAAVAVDHILMNPVAFFGNGEEKGK